ncbi:MAG: hypothetical protein ABIG42_07130, partial [bacterium]
TKSFGYHLKIMNLDDAPATVSIWAAAKLPWGAVYGPIIPPNHSYHSPLLVPLEPLQVMEFNPTQTLPAFAPLGEYVYHVRIGEFVDNINDILDDDASFSFWIVD